MPNNYVLLETISLTQSAASVTFDNLPTSGYTDLKIVYSARSTGTRIGIVPLINGSSANITTRGLEGDGSSASSYTSTNIIGYTVPSSATASTFGNTEVYIPNYRSSNFKSISADSVNENNATSAFSLLNAFLWSNTAAITSLTLQSDDTGSNSIAAGSTFSLYGVAALGTTPVLAPQATGGNIVANDGTYWYHAFLSSGNFVPQTGLTADVLVIAGGGAGVPGDYGNSGGGAGGLIAFTGQNLTAINYTCTVGAGGAGRGNQTGNGLNGTNSTFAALTAAVGGGGGGGFNVATTDGQDGRSGGSGGGGSFSAHIGGAGTAGQGNNGGAANGGAPGYPGGGGGGAGAVGATPASATSPGNGGVGSSAYSSWGLATTTGQNVSGTVYFAGGGAGSLYGAGTNGTGGNGGGGFGSSGGGTGGSGTANTGGGGGGAGVAGTGGSGGSGIILIRYPIA
jgi:hypothetical protein